MAECFSLKTCLEMKSAAGLSTEKVAKLQRFAAPPSSMPQRRSRPK